MFTDLLRLVLRSMFITAPCSDSTALEEKTRGIGLSWNHLPITISRAEDCVQQSISSSMFTFLPVRKFFTQLILVTANDHSWPTVLRSVWSQLDTATPKASVKSVMAQLSHRLWLQFLKLSCKVLEELPQIRRCPPPYVSAVSGRTGFGWERLWGDEEQL